MWDKKQTPKGSFLIKAKRTTVAQACKQRAKYEAILEICPIVFRRLKNLSKNVGGTETRIFLLILPVLLPTPRLPRQTRSLSTFDLKMKLIPEARKTSRKQTSLRLFIPLFIYLYSYFFILVEKQTHLQNAWGRCPLPW